MTNALCTYGTDPSCPSLNVAYEVQPGENKRSNDGAAHYTVGQIADVFFY